ncbi:MULTISPECIES: hypothetical protein [Delftia]|uniref:hypothetical protein n=1 Tax=Delftia TaxID=80865 RepID=UPI0012CC492B|nr:MULTISPECIES: hypothetical protein [Delftia]MBS3721747.1 hypothetical protein [Delftia sp. PE138]MCO5336004.1 hypothetical protein [Delftia tsuruhatensis]MCR4544073.1 hypothetical protein [Delftia tsuruhatensis]MPT04733.1 hypothetical protein [Delftia sp.]
MPDTDMPASVHPAQAVASPPDPETLATDALCHISAALSVLEMHVERSSRAMVIGVRDLLRGYHHKADRAAAEQPVEALASSVLPQMSADLQGLLEIIDRVNDDETDDPILYAVSYLLRAAKRFSDAAAQA